MKAIQYYHSPIGLIGIIEEEQAIARILYPGEILEEVLKEEETSLLKEAKKQMKAYFANQLQQFDLPLRPVGTPFMQEVWKALLDIPYGELRSYKDIAEAVGRDKAYRAVGLANNRNPIPIIIPCHRVVGANGKLVGYGGGLEIKEYLIELEQKSVRD
ncbi:methylated-DNA--[protein]-cysteine S-methyltransferase [Niameybacter massiliensis]|uniref:Methylated-DNA--protein-cysteine methyltransferase n=1 Tax=Holtiella tumoricola TaxID=3018743 RepID=A0AA42DQI7_9FIRM|nr:methylated-DNA--[protein]-cysteine S-methyltransferase [Holtiella tumoricola]MDA3733478.1 methylated-DNA--[protein]-cysteine S-methyltransferase [Holtiella tumoricola]